MVRVLRGSSHPALPHSILGFPNPRPPRYAVMQGGGSRAITFPEMPHYLGLPSIYDPEGFWDPVFDACNETGTVSACTSARARWWSRAPSRPAGPVILTMNFEHRSIVLTEWLLLRHPGPAPEARRSRTLGSQIGWMPYILGTLDKVYHPRGVCAASDDHHRASQHLH